MAKKDTKKKKGAKPAKRTIHRKRVTLVLNVPHAENVCLMGDFNQWNQKVHPMKQDPDGIWKKIIVVQPGRYEYRFLVDGRWQNDPANESLCPNCFGTENNVLEVSG